MTFRQAFTRCLSILGKQLVIADKLGITESSLSKKLAGDSGWSESEIDIIITSSQLEIAEVDEYKKQIASLKEAMRIILEGEKT